MHNLGLSVRANVNLGCTQYNRAPFHQATTRRTITAKTMSGTAAINAKVCMDAKAKPPGSLGQLEEWAIRLATLQGTLKPRVAAACLLLFAADHGVTQSNPKVSAYPRQVTPAMFSAIAAGQAASSILCTPNNMQLILSDVGVDADVTHAIPKQDSGIYVVHDKVAPGTACFTQGPAMTEQQLQHAMQAGANAVALACHRMSAAAATAAAAPGRPNQEPQINNAAEGRSTPLVSEGVVCIGELGIGNTTAAAALLAALSGAAPQEVCGRGTGVDNAGLTVKQQAVAAALSANEALIKAGPLSALQAVGGFELAAMTGAYIAAAERRMPVIVDGFVSGVAALAAVRHDPAVKRCLFLSHASAEAGTQRLVQELECSTPVLDMQMRLGEGTGAVLCVPLLKSAAAVMSDMASLEDVMKAGKAAAASVHGQEAPLEEGRM